MRNCTTPEERFAHVLRLLLNAGLSWDEAERLARAECQ